MSRMKLAAVLAAALTTLACALPGPASATGSWARPVDGAVALGYGRTWVDTQGHTCTHGGLDLVAPAGAFVRACGPGSVVFAGLVPAGEGARAYAVTVLTADGLRVTYLPLASVSVAKGQEVSAGRTLGELFGSGDASSPESHLHLGVKRGSAALDPAAFLAPPTPVTPPAPRPVAPTPHPVAPAPHPGRVPAPRQVPSPQPSPQPAPAPVPAPIAVPSVAEAAGQLARGASDALALVAPLGRVEPVAVPAVFDPERAAADLETSRSTLLSVGLRIGLVLLAGACLFPVLRAARSAGAQASPVVVRRDRS